MLNVGIYLNICIVDILIIVLNFCYTKKGTGCFFLKKCIGTKLYHSSAKKFFSEARFVAFYVIHIHI